MTDPIRDALRGADQRRIEREQTFLNVLLGTTIPADTATEKES